MEEKDRIAWARQGDVGAFEGLVREYQSRLVAFLWNLLGSGDDARDAAQESFVLAYARLGQFDTSRSFRSWLFAIAYHHGIDQLRRRRRFRRFWLLEAAAADRTMAGAPAALDESPFWRPILGRITPQERAVLALKYNEDCGSGEIAAMLGCSESTVRVHLLNARKKLRKELAAAGFTAAAGRANAEEAP